MAQGSHLKSGWGQDTKDIGEDSSVLGSKKSHSIKHPSKGAESRLVNKVELQRSFFWTGSTSKEYTSGEGDSSCKERASGAETDVPKILNQDWCSVGNGKG